MMGGHIDSLHVPFLGASDYAINNLNVSNWILGISSVGACAA